MGVPTVRSRGNSAEFCQENPNLNHMPRESYLLAPCLPPAVLHVQRQQRARRAFGNWAALLCCGGAWPHHTDRQPHRTAVQM